MVYKIIYFPQFYWYHEACKPVSHNWRKMERKDSLSWFCCRTMWEWMSLPQMLLVSTMCYTDPLWSKVMVFWHFRPTQQICYPACTDTEKSKFYKFTGRKTKEKRESPQQQPLGFVAPAMHAPHSQLIFDLRIYRSCFGVFNWKWHCSAKWTADSFVQWHSTQTV